MAMLRVEMVQFGAQQQSHCVAELLVAAMPADILVPPAWIVVPQVEQSGTR